MMKKNIFDKSLKSSGFTLVEIMAVIIIITILVSFAIPTYYKTIERARISGAQQIMSEIRSAEERYALEHGNYSTGYNISALDIDLPSSSGHWYDANFQYAPVGIEDVCTDFLLGCSFPRANAGDPMSGGVLAASTRKPEPKSPYGDYIVFIMVNGSFACNNSDIDDNIFDSLWQ